MKSPGKLHWRAFFGLGMLAACAFAGIMQFLGVNPFLLPSIIGAVIAAFGAAPNPVEAA